MRNFYTEFFFSGGFLKKAEIQIGRGNEKSGNPLKRGDFTGLSVSYAFVDWIETSKMHVLLHLLSKITSEKSIWQLFN